MPTSEAPTDLSATDPILITMQDEVRDFFGWSLVDDVHSAQLLLSRVEDSDVESWARHNRLVAISRLYRRLVIRDSEVIVLGAAIEPEEVVIALERPALLVAADGSSGALSELPRSLSEKAWSRLACIVSDADGGDGTVQAVKRSVPIVLHAHGNNLEEWNRLLYLAETMPDPPNLVLTHQTPARIPGMHNPGGFTDGDRTVCFLTALGVHPERISLLGTRTDIIGRWSGVTQEDTKLQKLRWMKLFLTANGLECNH